MNDQAAMWSGAASRWLAGEDRVERVGGLPGRLAMQRLALRPGDRALDVGCGSGGTTRELAQLVAPGGAVTGVDIAPEMVEHARQAAGLPEVTFVVADASVADLGTAEYDVVYSRFGVMFFDEPVAAFAHLRGVLHPGGRLGFVSWRALADNDWMRLPATAATAAVGAPPPDDTSTGPGAFSLADPTTVRDVLSEAGFVAVEVSPHLDELSVPEQDLAAFAAQTVHAGHGPVQQALRSGDSELQERILYAVEAALQRTVRDGHARLTRGTNVVTARVPRHSSGQAGA